MKLLLDTHVLIWWDMDSSLLSQATRDLIADPDNTVFISAATAWEIAIKRRNGKIHFSRDIGSLIDANGFLDLPIDRQHAEKAGMLEWLHKDPFDRLLVAQALLDGLVLVHADREIGGFGSVAQLWAR